MYEDGSIQDDLVYSGLFVDGTTGIEWLPNRPASILL